MSSVPEREITPAQYLARERRAPTKSEYRDGLVVAMTGASRVHNRIAIKLLRHVDEQLDGRRCEAFGSDMRVRCPGLVVYAYPDLSIVGGESEFEDDHLDSLTNPTALVEILSPSTEAYDRGKKFGHYQRIETLKHYVLVATDEARIEVFDRSGTTSWTYRIIEGLDRSLALPAVGIDVPLTRIYEGVELGG